MSHSVTAITTLLAQRQLDIILKSRGRDDADAPVGQKFADVMQTPLCIPFVAPQILRTAMPLKQKRSSSKDRRADEQERDGSGELANGRQARRNPHTVDVRV